MQNIIQFTPYVSKVVACKECGSTAPPILTSEFYVCANCGLCSDDPIIAETLQDNNKTFDQVSRFSAPYNRLYYWNERLRFCFGDGPKVPDDVMEEMDKEYEKGFQMGLYPERSKLLHGHVLCICSRARYNGHSTRKYQEKWKMILHKLSGRRLDYIPHEVFSWIVEILPCIQVAWYQLRQNRARFKKCKSFPNFNEIMRRLLTIKNCRHLLIDFPPLKTKSKRIFFERIWKCICKFVPLPYEPAIIINLR